MEGSMNRASREAGNILCLDLIDGYIDVFNVLEFRALCIYDLCTFLHISYTLIQLKHWFYYFMVTYYTKYLEGTISALKELHKSKWSKWNSCHDVIWWT